MRWNEIPLLIIVVFVYWNYPVRVFRIRFLDKNVLINEIEMFPSYPIFVQ